MKQANAVIEMAAMKRTEQLYRTRLANEPDDATARIKLAWCLFMQALYRAGQESMIKALFSSCEEESLARNARIKSIWDQDSDDLLRDCLAQTSTVLQLSTSAKCRADAQRLQSLVKLSGGEEFVSSSRENSSRILIEVLQEVL